MKTGVWVDPWSGIILDAPITGFEEFWEFTETKEEEPQEEE